MEYSVIINKTLEDVMKRNIFELFGKDLIAKTVEVEQIWYSNFVYSDNSVYRLDTPP